MDHKYEQGWQRYGFDNQGFEERSAHGAETKIAGRLAFNRGLGNPHVNFAIIPADTPTNGIGLHIHRNLTTGKDAEVWYIIVEGQGEMTFTNGDVVSCGQGDLIVTYPGTGHAFRAIGGPVKVITVTPEMYTFNPEREPAVEYPDEFDPQIKILDFDEDGMCVRKAVCAVCGAEWNRPESDAGANTLPGWAREHRHENSSG